jgi:poly-gamma-glutamate synthesis protein (capsule biosynthesis protein)
MAGSPHDRRRAGGFELVWVGDCLLGDAAQRHLDQYGYEAPFTFLRPLLAGDYLIGNAEGPITTRTEVHWPDRSAIHNHNSRPAAAAAFARVGFDAMSLANNHALDRGPAGLADTIDYLRIAGVQPFGAGRDNTEAERPLLIDTGYGVLAVVAMGEPFRYGRSAAPDTAGLNSLSRHTALRGRELAKAAGARWVAAFVHWGRNYQPVTEKQRRRAAGLAAAGYDLIIGHGSHIIQPVEFIDGVPVLYSLGNFTFGTPGRFAKDGVPGHGLIARTVFGRSGLTTVALAPIATDNRVIGYRPRPCRGREATAALRAVGPGIRRDSISTRSLSRWMRPRRSAFATVTIEARTRPPGAGATRFQPS